MTPEERDPRPYFTVTNEYPRHRKIRALTDRAFRLHITLMALCNEDLNNGVIGPHDLNMLGPKPGKELLDAGLVHTHPDGYQLHDYLRHQKSAAQVEDHVNKRIEAGARGGTIGMHNRWHVARNKFNPNCVWCADLDSEPPPEP
ncbi:hypothetical protein [Micrococcus terreus]|uniref:hypothetical protein n=1 Tax=Micrococcus terreus TaxID=574650 RepID=UPI003D7638A9